jgi:hypothetical protein
MGVLLLKVSGIYIYIYIYIYICVESGVIFQSLIYCTCGHFRNPATVKLGYNVIEDTE